MTELCPIQDTTGHFQTFSQESLGLVVKKQKDIIQYMNKMALVKTDKNIQKAKLKSKPKPTGYWLRFYVPLDTK